MDNNPFDNMQSQHHGSEFVRIAAATFVGAWIGSRLDNTQFGRWFNTSKFIGLLFKIIGIYVLYLAGVFIYELIKIW